MAFAHPSRLFKRHEVESLNPNHNGVYGLLRSDAWVYIGRGNIREGLLTHFTADEAVALERPTHWTAEVTPNPAARADELIEELYPICNRNGSE
jgi:hypothetical protein